MFTILTGLALAAAAQTTPTAPALHMHAQHPQTGQAHQSQMDHSKMGQSNMAQHDGGCCKQGADGKMECAMHRADATSTQPGHSRN